MRLFLTGVLVLATTSAARGEPAQAADGYRPLLEQYSNAPFLHAAYAAALQAAGRASEHDAENADAHADDLSDCFNMTQPPTSFQTIPAPFAAAHFLEKKGPPVDPDDE